MLIGFRCAGLLLTVLMVSAGCAVSAPASPVATVEVTASASASPVATVEVTASASASAVATVEVTASASASAVATGRRLCPPVPADVSALLAISRDARLLRCFSGRPIAVQARLIGCNCDVDGGAYEPRWFSDGSQPLLLVEPSETSAPAEYNEWLIVRLDPSGTYPAVVPVGDVVEVTGMFDHPAARDCTYQGLPDDVNTPAPTSKCRYMFVTTSIVAVR
jgi:hypothetical protein